MLPEFAQVTEQVVNVLAFRHEHGFLRQLAEVHLVRPLFQFHHQVADVQHADDVVHGLFVDGKARERRREDFGDVLPRRVVGVKGQDINSRSHYLPHRGAAHLHDGGDHLALVFLQVILDRRGVGVNTELRRTQRCRQIVGGAEHVAHPLQQCRHRVHHDEQDSGENRVLLQEHGPGEEHQRQRVPEKQQQHRKHE